MGPIDHPLLLLVSSCAILWLAAEAGNGLRVGTSSIKEEDRDGFGLVMGATLTLLGLLIGFTFSMAITRYDQRKNYEEAEANAIGTEYARADLLTVERASRVRELLKEYAVAFCCNLLIGYGVHFRDWRIFVVLPLMVSIAFFLIADIDSPRRGHILVNPQNLELLLQSMREN